MKSILNSPLSKHAQNMSPWTYVCATFSLVRFLLQLLNAFHNSLSMDMLLLAIKLICVPGTTMIRFWWQPGYMEKHLFSITRQQHWMQFFCIQLQLGLLKPTCPGIVTLLLLPERETGDFHNLNGWHNTKVSIKRGVKGPEGHSRNSDGDWVAVWSNLSQSINCSQNYQHRARHSHQTNLKVNTTDAYLSDTSCLLSARTITSKRRKSRSGAVGIHRNGSDCLHTHRVRCCGSLGSDLGSPLFHLSRLGGNFNGISV